MEIAKGANVIHVDLDKTKTVDRVTSGWTDEMIKNYSSEQLEEQIQSCKNNIKKIEKTKEDEEKRLDDLYAIRARKRELA